MKITVVTLFPELVKMFCDISIVGKAQKNNLFDIEYIDIRKYALDTYGTVDDRPYGGGAGMVLRPEPILKSISEAVKSTPKLKHFVLLSSARGVKYDQKKAIEYSKKDHLIIIAGHYEGVDERVLDMVDEEISLGDYILTGGELPVACIIDSVVRLLPGVLKREEATEIESFFQVPLSDLLKLFPGDKKLHSLNALGKTHVTLLEYPQYTRPKTFGKMAVPEVLLSGNHEEVRKYQIMSAYEITLKKRPDLLDK